MSREHLYKAKRVNWRELPKEEWWVEGNLITNERDEAKAYIGYLFDVRNGVVEDFDIVEVIPETVCEHTGLTDKNGKRFEGYIFQASDGDYVQRYVITWNKDSLEWSADCIGNPDGTLPLSEFRVSEIEVIGNVFDNPELLEGGEAE